MNQPEKAVLDVAIPLQQYQGQLISKGYSYREIKEENAVISIFRSGAPEPTNELVTLSPLSNN